MKSGPFAFPCPGTTCVRPSPCRSHRVQAVSSAAVGRAALVAADGRARLPSAPDWSRQARPSRCSSIVLAGAAALVAADGRARAPRAPPGARSARSHSTVRVPSSRSSSNACSKAVRIFGKSAMSSFSTFDIRHPTSRNTILTEALSFKLKAPSYPRYPFGF